MYLSQLVEMNANWQSYNDARKREIALLEERVEAGRTEVEGMTLQLSREQRVEAGRTEVEGMTLQPSREQQEEMDRLMQQHKQRATEAEEARMEVRLDCSHTH